MQTLNLKIKGLYTHPSELSEVPEGALLQADNIVIDEESTAEPRRGFDRLAGAFGASTDRANKITVYQEFRLAHYGSASLAYHNGTTAWADISTAMSPPSSTVKVRFAEANRNLYMTSSTGIRKLTAYNGTLTATGAPKGLNLEATLSGASGFFTTANQVAYRVVWGFEDANGNLVLGAPSQREVITNGTGSGADVSLVVTIPTGVTTDWLYQIYRSPLSGGAAIEPSDELQLAYEGSPSSGDITAGYMTVTDAQPEELLGATIYTAPSQEGAAAENRRPPFAKDVCSYKGHTFFLNISRPHSTQLTLLARLQNNDTVTVGGIEYKAQSSETIATAQFKFFNAGTIAQDIADTAKSLVKIINRHASSTVYAYYMSGFDDLPGKILLERRDAGAASFTATSSRVASWYPSMPVTSSNDSYKNGLAFSKPDQPECVPLGNLAYVGSRDQEGYRALALRDSVFVFSEGGVYRLLGDDASNFRIEAFDTSVRLLAPESAVVLNNQIFALTDQGVVSITDTGTTVVSRQIENTLLELFGASLSKVKSLSHAVAYETDRKYILWTISTSSDTYATQAFVFNTFTSSWTRWTVPALCGHVSRVDDKLYLGSASTDVLLQERKDYTFRDHCDYKLADTISAVSSDGLTLAVSSSDQISAGDLIYQTDTKFSVVHSVNTIAGTLTMAFNGGLTAAACSVYSGIPCVIQWAPVHGGNPGISKHFREVLLMFKRSFVLDALIGFASDLSGSWEDVSVEGDTIGLWGFFTWGAIPWGGSESRAPVRTLVPREKQRASLLNIRFTHGVSYSHFKLLGLSAIYEAMSERVVR